MQTRQSTARGLSSKQKRAYAKKLQRDRATIRRKVFFPEKLRKHITDESVAKEEQELRDLGIHDADVAPNDSGLPGADAGKARNVELWCKHGSWQICRHCHSVHPKPLKPMDTKRMAPRTTKSCSHCRNGGYVPQPAHVPRQLRDLNDKVTSPMYWKKCF